MSVRSHLPGYRWFHFFRSAAIRTGVYVGVCLTLVFVAWVVIANQLPFLERFALERNDAAKAVFGFLASIPVLRFFRHPGNLLASSLIGWFFFATCYTGLCLVFSGLSNWHSPLWVFVIGAVVYTIFSTVCWIGTCIWRARTSHVSHPNHHAG